MFSQIYDACKAAPSTVWLRVDTSKMDGPPKPEEAEKYGKALTERMRKTMVDLGVGTEGGITEGIHLF